LPIAAEVIDENSFADLLLDNTVYFFGNGAKKCEALLAINKNAFFINDVELSANNMALLSDKAFSNNEFEDVSRFEPFYLKDFLIKKPKL